MVMNWGCYESFSLEVTVAANLTACGSFIIHKAFQNLDKSFSIPEDQHPKYRMSFGLILSSKNTGTI